MTSERNKSVQVRTAAYQTVSRLRTELNIMLSARGFQSVAQLHRCRGFRRNGLVVDAKHVAGAAFGVAWEIFEQRELLVGEGNVAVGAGSDLRGGIERQVGDG